MEAASLVTTIVLGPLSARGTLKEIRQRTASIIFDIRENLAVLFIFYKPS
jgi:hypothetical protein